MQNIRALEQHLLGEKEREKSKREKNGVNSGHYVLPATPKGSAHTLLGPNSKDFSYENQNNLLHVAGVLC